MTEVDVRSLCEISARISAVRAQIKKAIEDKGWTAVPGELFEKETKLQQEFDFIIDREPAVAIQ